MAQTGQGTATNAEHGGRHGRAAHSSAGAQHGVDMERRGGDGMDEERETEERDDDEGRCGDDWCELA